MAAALRAVVGRVLLPRTGSTFLAAASTQVQPSNGIQTKITRDLEGIVRPPPFDYRNKDYTFFRRLFDNTKSRIDDNSKIILVEGPIASGKTKLAQQLAKDLDMHFLPGPTMDRYFINSYGYDMRKVDHLLPENARTFDVNNYLKDPRHINVAVFQLHMYRAKYADYIDALTHILNTGQGVVLERSCYADFVFVEAMFNAGYISKEFHRAYYEIRANTIEIILKPHLVIYLDVPANVVQSNIRERNNENEVNSSVLQDIKYIEDIEHFYKHEFLREISAHAELLVYDWSHGGEPEIVTEDVVRIDFDHYPKHDLKLKEWRFLFQEEDWGDQREMFTNRRFTLMCNLELPVYYCPELLLQPEEAKAFYDVWSEAPGCKYLRGFNADHGDTGILLKSHEAKTANFE